MIENTVRPSCLPVDTGSGTGQHGGNMQAKLRTPLRGTENPTPLQSVEHSRCCN